MITLTFSNSELLTLIGTEVWKRGTTDNDRNSLLYVSINRLRHVTSAAGWRVLVLNCSRMTGRGRRLTLLLSTKVEHERDRAKTQTHSHKNTKIRIMYSHFSCFVLQRLWSCPRAAAVLLWRCALPGPSTLSALSTTRLCLRVRPLKSLVPNTYTTLASSYCFSSAVYDVTNLFFIPPTACVASPPAWRCRT